MDSQSQHYIYIYIYIYIYLSKNYHKKLLQKNAQVKWAILNILHLASDLMMRFCEVLEIEKEQHSALNKRDWKSDFSKKKNENMTS